MKNKLRDTTGSEKEVPLKTTNFNMGFSLGVVELLLLDKKKTHTTKTFVPPSMGRSI